MPNYKNKTIAYLSLEIALENKLPTYAGGLGVLAGDILRSAADVSFPMVGITLINRRGYLQQEITSEGEQIAHSEKKYDFSKLEKISKTITLQMGAEKVVIRAWRYWLNGASGKIPVYLLDSDLSQNSKESRRLTDRLYDANKTTRLRQEIILGRGGVKMLRALGYKIYKYHLNEGHGSLATVELLISSLEKQEEKKLASVRQQCVFTTHTPLPGAQDVFQKDFLLLHQADWPKQLNCLLEKGKLNMTKLGLYCCGRVNAVSKLHQAVSEKMFPNYPIDYVTNGVNSLFWTSPELAAIYNRFIPGWAKDPSLLVRVKDTDQVEIAGAHLVAKRRLLKYIQKKTGEKLEEQILTIVFARRFTPYKRPGLIFQDIKKLKEIAKRHGGLQLIFSGKAHPSDLAGQKLIKMVHNYATKLKGAVKIIFLPDYNLEQAKLLVSGADIWLNTPQRPLEASGTSGMKAAHNGVPQLSTNDGWWPEGCVSGQTGWMITEKKDGANNLYDLLDNKILPLYYKQNKHWVAFMISTISLNASRFNTGRVLKQYIDQIYELKPAAIKKN